MPLPMNRIGWTCRIAFHAAALTAPAFGQVTVRVSISSEGVLGNADSTDSSISADGRYVAFRSGSSNLVAGDTNELSDVFVRDRQSGTTERVSLDSVGAQGNGNSRSPYMTANARFVVFTSDADNLVSGDTNGTRDVFVRDRQSGATERVSVGSAGEQADGACETPWISEDGRFVSFWSWSGNLVAGDTNDFSDVFVHDRQIGTTERVSVAWNGAQADLASVGPSRAFMSADGRYVAFHSDATNLVPGDGNGCIDVFVRDRQLGTTERVSLDEGGAEANEGSIEPCMSSDGRYVAFDSAATDLVPGDTNLRRDIFVRDLQLGVTERVSVGAGGAQANGSCGGPALSSDGRFVGFWSNASNLVSGDTSHWSDIFVRDRQSGTTERASVGVAQVNYYCSGTSISADGRYAGFETLGSTLLPGDTNGVDDVYLHDRLGGPSFTSTCFPGVGGVLACPCSNPPTSLGRGCDNSAGTGGASLYAAGGTYLSSDSLTFTTSGERPATLSVVAQWTGGSASGVVFGMGVRCTSGALKRLYTKSAAGGSITAPNFAADDLQVSVRSAAVGDPITAGQSRWYFVYYRDPNILGGCPFTSTFNATQTGIVTWAP